MPNWLQFEKSPYLLQHRENPVDWRPWGEEAFQAARQADKPVFLSIGYSTCHWCHVMAHESFEDQTVAEAINQDFIPIKVDREERPDVDAVYMAACTAMTGSGGWPLTVLLTPEQNPFWAGTYLPKRQLLSLLSQAAQLWREDKESLVAAGAELTAHLKRTEEASGGVPDRGLVRQAVSLYAQSFDARWGGFGRAPKFPTPHNLIFLLRYAQRTGDRHAREMAEQTLEAMYRGGLFDHVGGGFARYSTDKKWLAPHFEKMLYDNALLALAYTEVYQETRRPLYAEIVRRTLDYVLRELTDPQGGFYCGQDADSEGVEGKYYVFTPDELKDLLEPRDADIFCRWYGVTPSGNFEGKTILNLIAQEQIDQEPERMKCLREKVYAYRLGRTQLHRDDKVLTAWNGLMIAAMAHAGLALDEPRYLDAAMRAVDFIKRKLTDNSGRLLARWREEQAAHPGKLDDYAFYSWGLLKLYDATFQTQYLAEARRLTVRMYEQFFDEKNGGFYPYASEGEQLITRTKETYDGAMPSGNSVAALVLSRLARLTGESRWRTAADLQLAYLAGAVQEYPAGYGFAMLAFLEELWPSAELVCASQEVPAELTAFLREASRPAMTVLVKTPETAKALGQLVPFTESYPIPEKGVRYYLCQNGACAQPVDSIAQVKAMLEKI
ncbi:thioredoxin domain-containing protein [Zongyangia hominis]|uniref:Thioredoxin domain-containing protein n=1 Tax=Zongyangia hominis TaxID=2763677 RepID=A0A926I763_9FIRM|nr:thioredoxin domain-containing protein [Zongyangia hominis]MBC8570749.1 thioredoxin domain-containing protein [Zongyangia hominis]